MRQMDIKHTDTPHMVPEKYEKCRKEMGVRERTSSSSKGTKTLAISQSSSGQPREDVPLKMDAKILFTLDDGFSKIHTKMDDVFKARNDNLSALVAYEKFEKFVRPHGMFVSDFLEEFEKLKKQIEDHSIFLPEKVLAYRVLKSANLKEEREKYVKSRVSELTYTAMMGLLRKIMKGAPQGSEAKNKNNNASQNAGKKKSDVVVVVNEKKEGKENSVNAESRRNQLMRDMAQLRLQAEVSQLEGSLEIDQPIFPPYLVAHTSALCDALPALKQLTQTARCIVIIPQAVIDILDFLKKSTAKAREAIRWLELEFRHGNRYIRAQKCNERLSGSGDSSLKKTNKDLWCLVEIVDCCRYLAQQSGDFSHSGVTTVLISNDPSTWEGAHFIKDMQQKGQCQDISFENINQFMNKWKVMWKSKG